MMTCPRAAIDLEDETKRERARGGCTPKRRACTHHNHQSMQTILGLTLLETLEHLARFFYITQLMVMPEAWLKQNLVSENTSAELLFFCRMSGCFLCCLAGARCCCASNPRTLRSSRHQRDQLLRHHRTHTLVRTSAPL